MINFSSFIFGVIAGFGVAMILIRWLYIIMDEHL